VFELINVDFIIARFSAAPVYRRMGRYDVE